MPKIKTKTKSSNVLKFSFTETLREVIFMLIARENGDNDGAPSHIKIGFYVVYYDYS